MPDWTTYKGVEVPYATPSGEAGLNLKNDLTGLADRAPFNSTSDPTTSDDEDDGFFAGSEWLNTSTQTMWVCVDATSGSAEWRSLYRRIDNAIILAPDAGVGSGADARALQFDSDGNTRGSNAVDLQRVRAASLQVAAGDNSGVLSGENNTAFAADCVVAGGYGNNAGGGSGDITSVATGNPATVTSANHGLLSGQAVQITGSASTPSIDGFRIIHRTGDDTFTVSVNVTGAGGAAGSWSTLSDGSSIAGGKGNSATGSGSHVAGGAANRAVGGYSHAEGLLSLSIGGYSHAEGSRALAYGAGSHAEGSGCWALGNYSHAEGTGTTATGNYSHAEGGAVSAGGYVGHAEGMTTSASGYAAHAEGVSTHANGDKSHAEGSGTFANANYSHAGGLQSKAHLRGQWARASGNLAGVGTAQTTITHLYVETTGASAVELTLDGNTPSSGNRFSIVSGQTLSCLINVVARTTTGGANNAGFLYHAVIRNNGGSTALIGTPANVSTLNSTTWSISITADDTNDSLKISVTGAASTTVHWMATVIASEVADSAI